MLENKLKRVNNGTVFFFLFLLMLLLLLLRPELDSIDYYSLPGGSLSLGSRFDFD